MMDDQILLTDDTWATLQHVHWCRRRHMPAVFRNRRAARREARTFRGHRIKAVEVRNG